MHIRYEKTDLLPIKRQNWQVNAFGGRFRDQKQAKRPDQATLNRKR